MIHFVIPLKEEPSVFSGGFSAFLRGKKRAKKGRFSEKTENLPEKDKKDLKKKRLKMASFSHFCVI